jgi:hypothetical protein
LQNLDKFVEQHGSSTGGDFFLGGSYSFAEVAGTPFVHRASAALPVLRGYSLDKAIQQQKLTRLDAWIKVIRLPLVYCIDCLSQAYFLDFSLIILSVLMRQLWWIMIMMMISTWQTFSRHGFVCLRSCC